MDKTLNERMLDAIIHSTSWDLAANECEAIAVEFANDKWINVSDELPIYYQVVQIFCYVHNRIYQAWRANDGDDDIWNIDRSDYIAPSPTYWQPLPLPPKN